MEPLLSRLIVQAAPRTRSPFLFRRFHISSRFAVREKDGEKPFNTQSAPDSSFSQPAADVSQNVTRAEKEDYESRLHSAHKEMQTRSPWTREGSDLPPVLERGPRSAGAMTKGKLLTTPSRMLKLILPLTTRDYNKDRKDVEPLALLVHPQQPLSYLERLVQSELPTINDDGKERAPRIVFRAEDSMEEGIKDKKDKAQKDRDPVAEEEDESPTSEETYELDNAEEEMRDGKISRTGKISGGKTGEKEEEEEAGEAREGKRSKSDADREKSVLEADDFPSDPTHPTFVRWSPSTEIGDFIRDAARGKEFAVDIEGAPESIHVGVPSFADRTYYLRMRLRKTSGRIAELADIKVECDKLARKGAKRIAQGGFAALIGWWGAVYYLTFKTELGWDVMEPVTYLVGLSGLIGGYMWFLYHNREVSYKSAMNFTVSRRQSQLYELKGFNLPRWEMLVEEGNRLRREIKLVAEEYDVDWDETVDEGGEEVREALRKERRRKKGEEEDDGEEDEGKGEEEGKEKKKGKGDD